MTRFFPRAFAALLLAAPALAEEPTPPVRKAA